MCLARFRGFATGWSPPFCNSFGRGMEEYAKFLIISYSVDTHEVCWLFGWGYFNDQSANKTRKKAKNLKFEIWFTDDQGVRMMLQTYYVDVSLLWITKFCVETIVRYSYQTLSPVRRTFVFLGSRCTQPLTPCNAHALRYEFKKTKRFCNEYSTYTLMILRLIWY